MVASASYLMSVSCRMPLVAKVAKRSRETARQINPIFLEVIIVAAQSDEHPATVESTESPRRQTISMDSSSVDEGQDESQPSVRTSDLLERLNRVSAIADSDTASTKTGESAKPTDSDEPSIEEYMAALLERSGGRSQTPDSSTFSRPSAETPADAESNSKTVVLPSHQVAEPTAGAAPDDWVQKPAPECRDDISDLRAVANMNARDAIETHWSQSVVFDMHGKLFVSLVAVVISFALISFTNSIASISYYGSIVALIVSITWGTMYLALGRQLAKVLQTPEPDQTES